MKKSMWGKSPSVLAPLMLRRYLAEFLGTFAYVFFGCGTKILLGNKIDTLGNLLTFLVFGFTLFAMTYALSHISAAPFNPAITLGLALTRHFPWRYVLAYWVAQVSGALAASALHLLLLPNRAARAQFGATIPSVGEGRAVVIETIITFFLMLVAMSTATERRVNRALVGLATGFTIALCGWFAGPLTGGSMNPARSLAPALFAGGSVLAVAWVYWVGPLLGAALGAMAYELMRGGKEHALEVPEGIFDELRKQAGRQSKEHTKPD